MKWIVLSVVISFGIAFVLMLWAICIGNKQFEIMYENNKVDKAAKEAKEKEEKQQEKESTDQYDVDDIYKVS